MHIEVLIKKLQHSSRVTINIWEKLELRSLMSQKCTVGYEGHRKKIK